MKHLITIQRLCLFLLVFLLAAPAWSYSITVKARDRSRGEVEGKRDVMSGGYIEARWSDCKTGPALLAANRNWKMKKGSTVTISCFGRWRFRGIRFREQLKNADKLVCISDNRYTGDPTSNSGLSCYDAPNTEVTLQANDDIEFAEYIIEFVAEPRVSFKKKEYTFFVGDQFHLFYDNMVENPYKEFPKFELSTEEPGMLNKETAWDFFTVIKAGKTNLVFRAVPDDRYAAGSIKVPFEVTRRTMDAYLDGPKTVRLQVWDNLSLPVLKRIPEGYDRSKITRKISDEKVVKIEGEKMKLGSDPFGKTATITYTLPEDHKYKTKTLTLTIIVPKEAEISSQDDWKKFCAAVNSGWNNADAKLMKDVDLGTEITMLGSNKSYSGTFDGQGHTLKINWNSGPRTWIAPFKTVNGATIRNLRTEGEINSSTHFLSGLVHEAYGNTTISGCVSAVNITSSYDNGGCDAAGMIECVRDHANVTITDCVVKGKFHATTEGGRRYMSGFVCNQYGKCTITNCLYIGENNTTTGGYTFCTNYFSGTTLNNCYYLNTCGTAQGTPVTKDQLRSGEVAYKLQAGRQYTAWGQNLDSDAQPMPTTAPAQRVYEVKFSYKGQVKTTRYANRDKGIYGSLPTAKEMLGSDFNPQDTYNLTFSGKFTTSTPVTADRTVIVTALINNCYMIGSKEEWKEFCELVKDGETTLNAKMTADVDLDTDIAMVGNKDYSYVISDPGKPYAGTFDGQGHTLKVNWYPKDDYYWVAPFQRVNGATIKNLCVTGYIISGMSRGEVGGLISMAEGNVTITNCITDMILTVKKCNVAGMVAEAYNGSLTMTNCVTNGAITNDRGYSAGMVSYGFDASVTMTDCLVKVAFVPLSNWAQTEMSGFIYDLSYKNEPGTKTAALNNCLYLGWGNVSQMAGSLRTFAPEKYTTLNNCYHLNKCGETPQGTQVTKKQLKSGEITKLLQAGRTDACHWAQVLGETPNLYHAPDKNVPNYVYYDAANNRWACEDFRLTDGTPLPIGLDFLATKTTYERTLSSKNNATVCLPYELPRNGSFDVHTLSGGQGSKVYFKPVNDKLEAYRPYYITANGTPQLGGTNLQVKAFHDDNLKTTTGTGHSITGTVDGVDNATAAAANAYILHDDGLFHKVTTEHSDATVPAYRAYIICPKASGAKELSIIIDGETTGIDGMTDDAAGTKNGPVYDLQGRRVADRFDAATRNTLPAGVYIVGGRKVVVK